MTQIIEVQNTNVLSELIGWSTFISQNFLRNKVSHPPTSSDTVDYQEVVVRQIYKNGLLDDLKNDIGEKLYNSLTDEDREFIITTQGMVNFGYRLTQEDSKNIEKALREDYEY